MPDADADRIIRSLKQENWNVSNKPRQAFPEIFQPGGALFGLHQAPISAVRDAFQS